MLLSFSTADRNQDLPPPAEVHFLTHLNPEVGAEEGVLFLTHLLNPEVGAEEAVLFLTHLNPEVGAEEGVLFLTHLDPEVGAEEGVLFLTHLNLEAGAEEGVLFLTHLDPEVGAEEGVLFLTHLDVEVGAQEGTDFLAYLANAEVEAEVAAGRADVGTGEEEGGFLGCGHRMGAVEVVECNRSRTTCRFTTWNVATK